MMMDRLRVASLQYMIRPVETFEQFEAQVRGLVGTAKDYQVRLLIFLEYLTIQLLTLNDITRPSGGAASNSRANANPLSPCPQHPTHPRYNHPAAGPVAQRLEQATHKRKNGVIENGLKMHNSWVIPE